MFRRVLRSTLDPTLDIVFKMLFAAPASHDVLVALLSAVLRPASPIRSVKVLNPEVSREQIDDKGIALDVLVELADGRRLDVEMQADKRPAFRERALYYWSRVFSTQLERGGLYTSLHPVISLLFLDYQELESSRLHSTFRILEVHEHEEFSDGLEIHVVELPKRPGLSEARQSERDLIAWSQFLGAKSDEEVEEACMSNAAIAKANDLLGHISATPAAQELARQRQMSLDTYKIELASAKHEGRSEGRLEGRVEGLVEALLDLMRTKFGGVDEEHGRRVRGATDDEVQRWMRRVLVATSVEEVFADA